MLEYSLELFLDRDFKTPSSLYTSRRANVTHTRTRSTHGFNGTGSTRSMIYDDFILIIPKQNGDTSWKIKITFQKRLTEAAQPGEHSGDTARVGMAARL